MMMTRPQFILITLGCTLSLAVHYSCHAFMLTKNLEARVVVVVPILTMSSFQLHHHDRMIQSSSMITTTATNHNQKTIHNGNNQDHDIQTSSSSFQMGHERRRRRNFIVLLLSTIASTTISLSSNPQIAMTSYGDSSTIEPYNYIEFLIEKYTQTDPTKVLLY